MDKDLSAELKLINLKNGLDLRDVSSGVRAKTDLSNEKDFSYSEQEAAECTSPALLDEDTYNDGESFEILGKKMVNLTEDGLIKKRILRHGYGHVIPDHSTVTIHLNAYLEYNVEPFHSTYLRKKPFVFTTNMGMTIPGIDIATQSMRLAEKSQFLIDYTLGCFKRVPPNSTVLFELEVINYVDAGAAVANPPPVEGEEHDYNKIDKYVHALCAKGNELFGKGSTKAAIKNYNEAVTILEKCKIHNSLEKEKQQKLLLRLLTNLVVSYTRIQEPRRACINCNKIYHICRGTSLTVPTKVHYNHGKCCIMLGNYSFAESKLKQAQRLEPQNEEINKELQRFEQKKKDYFGKAIFKNET